ncbi:MAG TPA: ubiquinone/menaquinone biosynthesis methyltransferase [Polyangiaceae bacterium]|nr:ubiquinone/menaquinone biosynthesis methyltransferase [Polyangiaceae bacterium]
MSDVPIADLGARRGEEGAHGRAARGMFERIAPTYDVLNKVMSAGIDRRWRDVAVARVGRAPSGPLLDLCAGTMDLAALLARKWPERRIVAVDFSPAMLERGRSKAPSVEVVVADAAALPLEDDTFAAVVCGFGMRNLADPVRGAREVLRVLRRGGVFVTLELFRPTRLATRAFHAAYARVVLPTLGGWVSGDRDAYRYLSRSMEGFLTCEQYARALSSAGFADVAGEDLTWGVASVVTGVKP